MDQYYSQYIKYKNKYIYDKKHTYNYMNMRGGGMPVPYSLKGIDLFNNNPEAKYLNPLYGFLVVNTDFLKNMYEFGDTKLPLHKFIRSTYRYIAGSFQPFASIMNNLTPYDIGRYLGYRYRYLVDIKPQMDIIDEIIIRLEKIIKDYNSIKTINKRKAQLEEINEENKYKINENKIAIDKLNKRIHIIENSVHELHIENYKSVNTDGVKIESTVSIVGEVVKEFTRHVARLKEKKDSMMSYKPIFDSTRIKVKDEYKNINVIEDYISKSFPLKESDKEFFHVVLGILWWNSGNKEGILEYYRGLNEELVRKVSIPANFETDIYTYRELDSFDKDDYLMCIAKYYIQMVGIVTLQSQEYAKFDIPCEINFADCGEASLRNFIKIITYSNRGNTFNENILDKLGAIVKVKNFFNVFSTDDLQSSDKEMEIFGGLYTSRNAWAIIVSNLPGVNYLQKCKNSGGSAYGYEINSKFALDRVTCNMLQVIRNLFTNIREWDDFNKYIEEDCVELELDHNYIGHIDITSDIGNYKWHFMDFHYYIENDGSEDMPSFTGNEKFTDEQNFYLSVITCGNYNDFKTRFLNDSVHNSYMSNLKNEWFYYIKYTKEKMIDIFNDVENNSFTDEEYGRFFTYMHSNMTGNDEKKRIFLNIQKLHDNIINMSDSDLQDYGIKYTPPSSREHNNLSKLKTNNQKLIHNNNIYNLESLTLECESIGNSLRGLTKLKTLNIKCSHIDTGTGVSTGTGTNININPFSDLNSLVMLKIKGYNGKLGNILHGLTKLIDLNIDAPFNTDLGNSLEPLNNLRRLSLNYDFNQNLNNSLCTLVNLSTLRIDGYISNIKNSLKGLTKLEELFIPHIEIYESGTGLGNMSRLKKLHLMRYVNTSEPMNKLINLKEMNIGQIMDVSDFAMIDSITSLKKLSIGYITVPIEDKLDKLVNLEEITMSRSYKFKNTMSPFISNIVKYKW